MSTTATTPVSAAFETPAHPAFNPHSSRIQPALSPHSSRIQPPAARRAPRPKARLWLSDRELGERALDACEARLLALCAVASGRVPYRVLGRAERTRAAALEAAGLVVNLDGEVLVLGDLGWDAAGDYLAWDLGLKAEAEARLVREGVIE